MGGLTPDRVYYMYCSVLVVVAGETLRRLVVSTALYGAAVFHQFANSYISECVCVSCSLCMGVACVLGIVRIVRTVCGRVSSATNFCRFPRRNEARRSHVAAQNGALVPYDTVNV